MTIAQDEKSCVVFGMPKEAIKLNAVDKIISIENIAAVVARMK
jgi:two-component system chemotaxis response regulator CheB